MFICFYEIILCSFSGYCDDVTRCQTYSIVYCWCFGAERLGRCLFCALVSSTYTHVCEWMLARLWEFVFISVRLRAYVWTLVGSCVFLPSYLPMIMCVFECVAYLCARSHHARVWNFWAWWWALTLTWWWGVVVAAAAHVVFIWCVFEVHQLSPGLFAYL